MQRRTAIRLGSLMRRNPRVGLRVVVASSVIVLIAATGSASAAASPGPHRGPAGLVPAMRQATAKASSSSSSTTGGEADEVLSSAEQFSAIRTAPATSVSADAFTAAAAAAAQLGEQGGGWQEVTNQPYNSDAVNYRDPIWSNSGAGNGLVAGRITALAVDRGTLYAGGAAGGVWRSTDGGANWTPVFDQQNDLSIGALAVDPADHSIWVGTGEANTNADSTAATASSGRPTAARPGSWSATRCPTTPSTGLPSTARDACTPPPTRACSSARPII